MRVMPERVWKKFVIGDGCWEWIAGTTSHGYGSLWDGGRAVKAHRYVYERLKGPIPEGLVIDHLCRNPACVRPSHLEPVLQAENVRRGDLKVHGDDQAQCRKCGSAMHRAKRNDRRRGWQWECAPCNAVKQRSLRANRRSCVDLEV